ncbi:MAG: HAMP domain-containing histidine kinase [Lachnospiraceae bacterium]|nr:HAMP domain-containing histidine kinase [Lachnospiraceae bacterium]
MKYSLRAKISLMVLLFSAVIFAVSWIICNYVIEGVFIWNVKTGLKTTFESCDSLFQNSFISEDEGNEKMSSVENPIGALVLIFDSQNSMVYTTISDESVMMQSMNAILDSLSPKQMKQKVSPGTFSIRRTHDVIINSDYYDLVGTLSNGYIIILRTPVDRISYTMSTITKVFVYVAAAMMLIGSAFMLILSNFITRPIKKLSRAARRISHLEFGDEIVIKSNDEIGELGDSMNEMARRLEGAISELKSANIKLEKDIAEKTQIDEMRKEFLSHVSHELKTPIALIQGYAEGLKDMDADTDKEDRDYYTDVIIDEAHKMNELVKRLLMLNEIEFGQTPLSIERFDITQMIKQKLNSSRILIEEAGAMVTFEQEEPCYVWADEYMIEEVFSNYLTNAIHYVREGGEIKIKTETVGDNIRVSVYNDGNKIPQEDIDKIFDKFYKVDKARTREYGGNGIGLSIVAAAMEAHGKKYGVRNEEDGVTFWFEADGKA